MAARRTKPKRPRGKKEPRKLGKSNSLTGKEWLDWLNFVMGSLGPMYFLILYLSQALCLRITQVLQLQTSDFDWQGKKLWTKKFKRHEGFFKPLLSSVFKQLLVYKNKGVVDGDGNQFQWPKKGYLFPAARSESKFDHIAKDTVCHAITRVRSDFVAANKNKIAGLSGNTIRSHSGRRRCITTMAQNSVPDTVGMTFAGIKSIRVYRGYVDTCPDQLRSQLKNFDRRSNFGEVPQKRKGS